jgi:hypothetical protein
VKPIVLWLSAQKLLEKLSGGKYPSYYYVVRDAVVAVDKELINNPVRNLCLSLMKEGQESKEAVDDQEPPSKKARADSADK